MKVSDILNALENKRIHSCVSLIVLMLGYVSGPDVNRDEGPMRSSKGSGLVY